MRLLRIEQSALGLASKALSSFDIFMKALSASLLSFSKLSNDFLLFSLSFELSTIFSSETAEERRTLLSENENFRILPQILAEKILPTHDVSFPDVTFTEEYVTNHIGERFYVQKWFQSKVEKDTTRNTKEDTIKDNKKDTKIDTKEDSKEDKKEDTINDIKKDKKNVPKSVIFYIHGYGSTISYSSALIFKMLCQEGHFVIAMDGFGHGRSDGLHAYIDSFEKYAMDYYEIYSKMADDYPHSKRTLLSVSMGALVANEILKKNNTFHGAIFISPLIDLPAKRYPNRFITAILILIASIRPKAKLTPSTDRKPENFENNELLKAIAQNPVFYSGKSRLRTSLEIVNILKKNKQDFPRIDIPVLILHGNKDEITSHTASNEFYEKISTKDKMLRLYNNESHRLLYESQAQKVYSDIFEWLRDHS